MITKRYRVSFDVEVSLKDFTPENLAELYQRRRETGLSIGLPDEEWESPSDEHIELQRQLYDAIVRNDAVLDEWLAREAVEVIAMDGVNSDVPMPYRDDGDILKPAIETLPPRARHIYREAMADGEWIDFSDEMLCMFEHRVLSCNVHPV